MGKFKVPVEWTVCDFVEVEADSFKDAVKYVLDNLDDIPLGTEPTYLEGSYAIEGQNQFETWHGEAHLDGLVEYLESCAYGDDLSVTERDDEVAFNVKLEDLKAFIKELGWGVVDCKSGLEDNSKGFAGWLLNQKTSLGGDFTFSVRHNGNVERAIDDIYDYYMSFDNDITDIEGWVDVRKASGAQFKNAVELVKEAEEIDEMLRCLSRDVEDWFVEEKKKPIDELISDATQICEEVNENIVGKNKIEYEME